MYFAIEVLKTDIDNVKAEAYAENFAVEIFEPKRFDGGAEVAVIVIPAAIATVAWISRIIIARIQANQHIIVKVDGVEIRGMDADNVQKILSNLVNSRNGK